MFQTLRDEYLIRLEKARVEIDRRVSHLQAQKLGQTKSLASLGREKQGLRNKAADLSEKYEDIKDNGDRITQRWDNILTFKKTTYTTMKNHFRIELVLQKIQRLNPVDTDAELRMQRSLSDIERKLKDLKNGLEQVRQKEKYQLRQISAVKKMNDYKNKNAGLSSTEEMGENQLVSIKEVLEQDSRDIADMIKKINFAKKDMTV